MPVAVTFWAAYRAAAFWSVSLMTLGPSSSAYANWPLVQACTHSASVLSFIMALCGLAAHMVSVMTPVKLWVAGAANSGTAASASQNFCITPSQQPASDASSSSQVQVDADPSHSCKLEGGE